MIYGKPVIGIAGGIGSGKSFVANLLGKLGCLVISADDDVRRAYDDPMVRMHISQMWGPTVFLPDGTVDRKQIASKIFASDSDRKWLESLLHPWATAARLAAMQAVRSEVDIKAFVWDTPLLFETGQSSDCDAILFVDTDREDRLDRVLKQRGWTEGELDRREKLQWPLDKKRNMSQYVLANTASAVDLGEQVRTIFSRILSDAALR